MNEDGAKSPSFAMRQWSARGETREDLIKLRVNETERARVHDLRRKTGCRDVADLVRLALNTLADRVGREPEEVERIRRDSTG